MANKNKTKGNANEREFCKIFGEIFEQPFQRVPNSGGMRGGLNNARSKNLSDNQKQLLENDIIPVLGNATFDDNSKRTESVVEPIEIKNVKYSPYDLTEDTENGEDF